jgi:hypothetical protein
MSIERFGSGGPFEDIYGYSRVMFAAPGADVDAVGRAHGELFGAVKPTSSLYLVDGMVLPEILVEVEVEAYRP